jgi:hypothetical protein
MGTFEQVNGGLTGIVFTHWAEWLLRGNMTSAQYFLGSGAQDDGWKVVSKNLNNIMTTPI